MFNLCRLLQKQHNNFSLEFKVWGQFTSIIYMCLVIETKHYDADYLIFICRKKDFCNK